MIDFLVKGGPVMVPILFCSVVAAAIIGERLWYLWSIQVDTRAIVEQLETAVAHHRLAEALSLCEEIPGPLGRILRAGLVLHDQPAAEITEAIEQAAQEEMPHLEKRLWILGTIAQISTLLGLLGTVTGMVKAFQVIQLKVAHSITVTPGDLAGGIWEALLTTVFGLVVAIPVLVAYNFLEESVNRNIHGMERCAARLVHALVGRSRAHDVSTIASA